MSAIAVQTASAETPSVATDIAPVQSIVASVMQGVGEPALIIPPGASPHGYALRPSEASALAAADLVVWVGPGLTPWLEQPLEALAGDARRLTLTDAPGIELLPVREGGPFEAHDHHAHGEADHESEAHGDEADGAHADHDHDHDHDHGEHPVDPHLWLDPANAAAIAGSVAAALADLDPGNAEAYSANADEFRAEMQDLQASMGDRLRAVSGARFFVFHDGYQYFEHAFDLPASGSVTVNDAQPPGAARVAEIRTRLREDRVVCVFTEPQFPPRLTETLIEGTGIRTGTLDPIGATLAPGPDLYPQLIEALTDGLLSCLGRDA